MFSPVFESAVARTESPRRTYVLSITASAPLPLGRIEIRIRDTKIAPRTRLPRRAASRIRARAGILRRRKARKDRRKGNEKTARNHDVYPDIATVQVPRGNFKLFMGRVVGEFSCHRPCLRCRPRHAVVETRDGPEGCGPVDSY
jgi:hypothetical protein